MCSRRWRCRCDRWTLISDARIHRALLAEATLPDQTHTQNVVAGCYDVGGRCRRVDGGMGRRRLWRSRRLKVVYSQRDHRCVAMRHIPNRH